MSLSARELAAVVSELAPLAGARVDEVRVHAERALTLELHAPGLDARLLLSAEPEVTRLHVARHRPATPEAPFAFQGLLRKELGGARLAAVELLSGDRVVALRFERAAGPVTLLAELTGRHGNLFLLDGDGRIRAAAARSASTRRELAPGARYVPPAPRPAGDQPPPPAPAAAPGSGPFPLSAELERRYQALEAERRLAEGRRRLREPVRAAAARARRALERLAEEAARVPAAEGDRRHGDLLKANLHAVPRGAAEVTLTEWTEEGPRQVRVALDPALGPRQNMERCYRRFRRIAESGARVEARAAEVRARAEALAALASEVEGAGQEALPRLEKEARRLGAGPRRAPAPRRREEGEALPYRTYRSVAGLPILVGRGAAQNDELTRRHARGNDLWLHVRGVPGAHVVVRLGGRPPDQETLLDAAHLAVHHSDARGAPVAEVAWTRARWVRKPRGSPPGVVALSQERVIALRHEPGRLARLLAEEEPDA